MVGDFMYNYFHCIGKIKDINYNTGYLTLTLSEQFRNEKGEYPTYELTFKLPKFLLNIFSDIEFPIGKKISIKGKLESSGNGIDAVAEHIILL